MSHNAKSIQSFVDKVNKEADKAAQAIFSKYQAEFEQRILAQMNTGDQLLCGGGHAFLENKKGIRIDNDFVNIFRDLQYPASLDASFSISELTK